MLKTTHLLEFLRVIAEPDHTITGPVSDYAAKVLKQAEDDGLVYKIEGGWRIRGNRQPYERRVLRSLDGNITILDGPLSSQELSESS